MDKLGSTQITNLFKGINITENPKEKFILKDNKYPSDLDGHGYDLASISLDILPIPWKKKLKTADTSIIGKEPIQEPINPRKR